MSKAFDIASLFVVRDWKENINLDEGIKLSTEDRVKAILFSKNIELFNEHVVKGYEPDEEDWNFLKTYAVTNGNISLYLQSCHQLKQQLDYYKAQEMLSEASENGYIEVLNHVEKEYMLNPGLIRKYQALVMRCIPIFSAKVKIKNKKISESKIHRLFEKKFLQNSNSFYHNRDIEISFLVICQRDLIKLKFWLILNEDIVAADFCEELIKDSEHLDWLLFGD